MGDNEFYLVQLFDVSPSSGFTSFLNNINYFLTDLFFLSKSILNIDLFLSNFSYLQPNYLTKYFKNNLSFFDTAITLKSDYKLIHIIDNNNKLIYNPNNVKTNSIYTKDAFSESSTEQRYNRFSNSLINYDYKTGNYIGD
jgi:hypothetical protein